ncbi:MAG: type II toxin-antitoxin system VapC family toxin, partial [Methylobacter sp.]
MIPPVLLDTSFLISLVDLNRPNHNVAAQYYRWLLQQQSPLYFSAIVAAELAIKQPITDFPLKNFRQIPFNIPHAIEAARIWNLLGRHDSGDNRSVVRDDVKLIAQALHEGIPFILTEDASTFYKYCERL